MIGEGTSAREAWNKCIFLYVDDNNSSSRNEKTWQNVQQLSIVEFIAM